MTDPGNSTKVERILAAHPTRFALGMCAIAFAFGLAFLPLPGLQYDEILFLHPFLYDWSLFRVGVEGADIPLMVMSYVGALKTWLYWPIYTYLPPSVWAVRLPMLLLGCVNLWLIYRLGAHLWQPAAGVVAIALAATDPTFLLTQLFDWGPVAIQVFLSLSAALLYLGWREQTATEGHSGRGGRAAWRLALCGFCCGLAIWNKAIFVWLLLAVGVAAVVCWPSVLTPVNIWRQTFRHWPVWLLATFSFALGAAPFLAYNLMEQTSTVKQNVQFEDHFPAHKLATVEASLDGHLIASSVGFSSAWEGYCMDGPLAGNRVAQPWPDLLRRMPTRTLTPYLLLAALTALLWCWRSLAARIGLFLLVVFLVHSGLAIMSIHGGTGLHHYAPVLPVVFLAVGGAWGLMWSRLQGALGTRVPWLRTALLIALFLAPGYAAVTLAAWHQRADLCGGQQLWTHASKALSYHVLGRPEQRFYVTDWGIDPQAIYFGGKRGSIGFLGILTEEVTAQGPHYEQALRILADPSTRLVSFVPGTEVIAQHTERLEAMLTLHRYTREQETVIHDPNGKSVYIIWKLRKSEARLAKGARAVQVNGTPRFRR